MTVRINEKEYRDGIKNLSQAELLNLKTALVERQKMIENLGARDEGINQKIAIIEKLMVYWTDKLSAEVYSRLCNCRSRKEDLASLVNARWGWYKDAGKDLQGFTKEDALIAVLEILSANGQDFVLTVDEYNELKQGA